MPRLENPETPRIAPAPVAEGIQEREEQGFLVLSPGRARPHRRVLYVNSYGGRSTWENIKAGTCPSHHLWGCVELVKRGYEIALADPLPDFYLYRNPLPHDLAMFRLARSWLGRDGILYCGHNVLYWLPLLEKFGLINARIVSLLFAREPLKMSGSHAGIIALTPAAEDHARKLAPRAKVAHLGWGADLSIVPTLPYRPEWFLSCGMTMRDHAALSRAAKQCQASIRVISPTELPNLDWPANVNLVTGSQDGKWVDYRILLHEYYALCAAVLIILKKDPIEFTAVGMTNLIEAMSMARPVIVTRTGALPSEIDVEKQGCGLHVPPEDPNALAQAIETLANDPKLAESMGRRARALAENHYNIARFAKDLHGFFETL